MSFSSGIPCPWTGLYLFVVLKTCLSDTGNHGALPLTLGDILLYCYVEITIKVKLGKEANGMENEAW